MMDFRAFEANPGISVILLPDAPVFTHVAVSNDFIRISGMRREEVIGKGHFSLFPKNPDDPNSTGEENLKASFQYILQTKQRHEIPLQRYDIPNGDGTFSQRYWNIYNAPILNDDGEVIYIIHSATDITNQVNAELKVEANIDIEKAFRLFMSAPVAVCIVRGPEFIVELANQEMLQFLGRKSAMVGKPIIESLPEAALQGLIGILNRVRKSNEPYNISNFPATILIEGERQLRYFDLVFKPQIHSPEEVVTDRIFCVAHNVTQQVLYQKNMEESEHRFRTLIEEAAVATALFLGRQLQVQYANEMMLGYWGKDSSVLGMPLHEAVPELQGQPFLDLLDKVYTTGIPYTGIEEEAYLKVDGKLQPFFFNYTYKPLRDKEGNIYGIHETAIDVTKDVRSRRRLEESEAELKRFKFMIDNAQDPFILIRQDGTFAYVNQKTLEAWEYTEEEVRLLTVNDIDPNYNREAFTEVFQKVQEGNLSHLFTTNKTKSGRSYPVELSLNIVHLHGEAHLFVVARDVTERKKADEAIRQSESNLRNMILQSPIAMSILKGPQYVVEIANDRMFELWGRSREQLQGKSIFEALPEAKDQGFEELLTGVYTTGKTFTALGIPINLPRNNSLETVYVNLLYEAFREADGTISGIMVVAIDVTEQVLSRMKVEQSEARARLAVESASLGTVDVDLVTGDIVYSDRSAEIFGFDPAKRWTYKNFTDTVHPEDVPIRLKAYEEAKHKGDLFYEVRIIRPDGLVKWIRLNGFVKSINAVPLSFVGTVLDITQEKKAAELLEQKIEERTRELKQVNEQLKQFSYSASHDLQEPLRKISYFVDRLLYKAGPDLNEETRQITERIQHTTGRMRLLIDDLLAYSNTTLGVTGFAVVDLNEVVKGVVDDMEATLLEKNAAVNISRLPQIKGDQRQLRQLFQNLISNALKYHKKEVPPKVEITSQWVNGADIDANLPPPFRERTFYEIQVKDNGIGFDQDDAERIFRLFQRLHGKAEYEGTGVGLAIVQKVVENHQGYIWAEGNPGEGAVFNVLLPAE